MKYMTDANLAHVAPKLRARGIDCDTLHMLMRNNERSQEQIVDGEIVAFLRKAQGTVTLITSDIDLTDHCKFGEVPHIPIWDAVADHILGKRAGRHPTNWTRARS
jgi:hypothetical protein